MAPVKRKKGLAQMSASAAALVAYDQEIKALLQKMKDAPTSITHADVIRTQHLMQQRQLTYEQSSDRPS